MHAYLVLVMMQIASQSGHLLLLLLLLLLATWSPCFAGISHETFDVVLPS